jgi:hypothetical protein
MMFEFQIAMHKINGTLSSFISSLQEKTSKWAHLEHPMGSGRTHMDIEDIEEGDPDLEED